MSTIRRLSMASAFLALAALGACTGSNGENGLVSISSEPAGANCANGGTKVSAGLDSNGNGVLDADEVDSTDYICNGDTGTGVGALVETSTEPPGANCPDGGVKIEVGLDANGNGVLDTDEINTDATTYACNGTGTDGLVQTSPEPAGANCVDGGIRVDVGLDTNGNGDLDPSEITETSYVCDGAGGVVGPSGIASVTSGIHVGVVDVTTDVAGPVSIHFTLKDDRGYPIDINGVYSVNTAITPRFMMAYTESDANGNVLPFVVLTKSNSSSNPTAQPTSYSPIASTPVGTLVENGYRAGDYTYTFPTTDLNPGAKAVAYDPTKMDNTHVIWIDAARQTDLDNTSAAKTFYATNQAYWYVPSGNGTAVVRELVKSENCASCHRGFKPEGTTSGSFHGGRRIDPKMCNICHNPARVSNPAADSDVFVHRLHNSQALQPANLFHGIEFGFPRDIRNCDTCHKDALQGAQATAQSRISQQACGSCHDYVSFTEAAPILCTDPVTLDPTTGLPLPCNHAQGPATDATCGLGCHAQLATQHKQVAPLGSGWIAATGYMPTGAIAVSYVISSVDLVDDPAITPNKRPQITFKFQQNGADVPFQDPGSATELWANYTGSPRVYFAFAVPQDGIDEPADFNGTASGTVKDIWAGTATGSSAGTMTGPDGNGFYTITLTGVQLPPETSLLTGGVGYSGGMVQMNVSGYATGLTIPARATWKTGTGMTARRPIVDTAKCENCHAPLGVSPTFHSGARNDGPTCSFCHTPNRTSSGWSATSRAFVHGIHGARAREVAYNWHASSAEEGFWDIEFPGPINDCTACHLDNTYNFRATATNNVLQNMQPSTVGQGTYNPSISLSPYVATDGTNYGTGFSFSTTTGLSTEASPTTLVTSPIVSACTGCHDSTPAIDHMRAMGGHFYDTRANTVGPGATTEQCLVCHGPGTMVDIEVMHR